MLLMKDKSGLVKCALFFFALVVTLVAVQVNSKESEDERALKGGEHSAAGGKSISKTEIKKKLITDYHFSEETSETIIKFFEELPKSKKAGAKARTVLEKVNPDLAKSNKGNHRSLVFIRKLFAAIYSLINLGPKRRPKPPSNGPPDTPPDGPPDAPPNGTPDAPPNGTPDAPPDGTPNKPSNRTSNEKPKVEVADKVMYHVIDTGCQLKCPLLSFNPAECAPMPTCHKGCSLEVLKPGRKFSQAPHTTTLAPAHHKLAGSSTTRSAKKPTNKPLSGGTSTSTMSPKTDSANDDHQQSTKPTTSKPKKHNGSLSEGLAEYEHWSQLILGDDELKKQVDGMFDALPPKPSKSLAERTKNLFSVFDREEQLRTNGIRDFSHDGDISGFISYKFIDQSKRTNTSNTTIKNSGITCNDCEEARVGDAAKSALGHIFNRLAFASQSDNQPVGCEGACPNNPGCDIGQCRCKSQNGLSSKSSEAGAGRSSFEATYRPCPWCGRFGAG